MTAPFEKRTANAIANPRFRLSDFPGLIAEGAELCDVQRGIHEQANADAIDFRLSEEDRDDASKLADTTRRRLATIAAAVDALETEYAKRQSGEKVSKVEAERKAALAERDEIAARFRAIVPQAVEALTSIFADVVANQRRLTEAGVKAIDAEGAARGLSGYYDLGPIDRFTAMKIPKFEGKGRSWPVARQVLAFDPCKAAKIAQDHLSAHETREKAARGLYRLFPVPGEAIPFQGAAAAGTITERSWMLANTVWTGTIRHDEVERLRVLGVRADELTGKMADA